MGKLELALIGRVHCNNTLKHVFIDLSKLFKIEDNEPYIASNRLLVIEDNYLINNWNNIEIKSHKFETFNDLRSYNQALYLYEISSNKLVITHGDHRIILCTVKIGIIKYYIIYESGEFKVTIHNDENHNKDKTIDYVYKDNKIIETKDYRSKLISTQKENLAKYKLLYSRPGISVDYSDDTFKLKSINYKLPPDILQELIYSAEYIDNDSLRHIGHIDKLVIPSWINYNSWICDKNAHIGKLEVYGTKKIHFTSINDIGIKIDTLEFKTFTYKLDKVTLIFDGDYPDDIHNIIFPEGLQAISMIGVENIHLQRLKFPERVLVINGCIQNSTIDTLDLINLPYLELTKYIFKKCTIGKVIIGPKSSRLIPKIFTDCNVKSVDYSI